MNTNHARNWRHEYNEREKEIHEKVVVRVKKKSWLTKGEKLIYSFFCILLISASIYIVSFSASTDKLNRELQTLEHQVHQLKLENESLDFEIQELSKPERITQIAKDHGLKIQATEVKRASN